jgi:ferritin-like metal-binding protein YciE
MQTAHEFFIHELKDMLDAEQQLVKALGEQESISNRPELKKAFGEHRRQTEQQAERLRRVFESIEESADEGECSGIRGLVEEVHNFMEEDPSPDLIDVFNVGAAKKVEAYEAIAYKSLIELAQDMGHRKAVQLLRQNLREEEQTFKKMDGFSKKIKPERSGMEEEEEVSARSRSRRSRSRSRRAA